MSTNKLKTAWPTINLESTGWEVMTPLFKTRLQQSGVGNSIWRGGLYCNTLMDIAKHMQCSNTHAVHNNTIHTQCAHNTCMQDKWGLNCQLDCTLTETSHSCTNSNTITPSDHIEHLCNTASYKLGNTWASKHLEIFEASSLFSEDYRLSFLALLPWSSALKTDTNPRTLTHRPTSVPHIQSCTQSHLHST